MSLAEYINDEKTDKNMVHSYIPLYEQLFAKKKNTAKHV